MKKEDLSTYTLPDTPGVYFFMGEQKKILYIGKATSLKNRVRSYFDVNLVLKRSPLISQMVDEAISIDFVQTESVLEALLLEVNLIRTHKPKYNTRSKDDKSYNHLVITRDEYPRVIVVRGKDIASTTERKKYKKIYGPFPDGKEFLYALKILKRLFPVYDFFQKEIRSSKNKMIRGRIDFNRQIGLYPREMPPSEYIENVRHIQKFFEGKKAQVLTSLERKMSSHAQRHEFEEANSIKKRLFALQHIQDVALMRDDTRFYTDDRTFRIEGYDVAHFGGKDMVGVMIVVEGGTVTPSDYRMFKIATLHDANDPAALIEVARRRFAHSEWRLPQIIVVDGNRIQINAMRTVLDEYSLKIPVVSVLKDEQHTPVRIVGDSQLAREYKDAIYLANSESHRFALSYHKKRRRISFIPSKHKKGTR